MLAQALACLRQGGEAAHLLIEGSGSFLKVLGHGVESGGQLTELISTPDLEPLGQVAARDRLRTAHERLDRPGQAQGQQVADQQQHEHDPREERRHLDRGLRTGLHDALARDRHGDIAGGLLAQVEVGELKLVFLAADRQASRRGPAGR